MIPKNLEYLFEYDGYEFYGIEEFGFSNKKFAKENKLYENFGHNLSSTYYEIYTVNLYEQHKLSQIWAFKNDIPIGLYLGVHYDTCINITDSKFGLAGSVIGQINLFTNKEHRKKGLSAKIVPILENMLLTVTPHNPCIVLQDNAYKFKKYLLKSYGLPLNNEKGVPIENKNSLAEYYENLHQNSSNFKKKSFSQ